MLWKRTTIDDWLADLQRVYVRYDPDSTILAGFSYGAMTALVAAAKLNPAELWCFSLSPYFHEDLKNSKMKQTWLDQIGVRRVRAFDKLVFTKLSRAINCKTLLFVGQKEINKYPIIDDRAKEAHALLKHNQLIVISGAGHDVSHPQYRQAIERAI